MNYQPPKAIALTDYETQLYKGLLSVNKTDGGFSVADAMENLFMSLKNRNAIPEIRMLIFRDPKYAELRSKSPEMIFKSNGLSSKDIIRHGHFIEYLRYFIEGPCLPDIVIKDFCEILNNDGGTSGILLEKLCRFVRSYIRENDIDRKKAASNFFRLAQELYISNAHSIRKSAINTR